MSQKTTGVLDETQLLKALDRSKKLKIEAPADVLVLGAETQRKLGELDPEITKLMLKDLGPVGELLVSMEDTIGNLNAEDVLNMEPNWLDELIERYEWLRKRFGPLARFAKRYTRLEKTVSGYVSEIDDELSGLVGDVTLKEGMILLYQKGEIDLLIEARAGEIILEALKLKAKDLEPSTVVTSTHQLPTLEITIQTLSQRIANLLVASDYLAQSWFQMETSRGSEWSLIEKVDSGKKLDVFMFRQAARAAASALRMCRVSDLVNKSDAFRDAMALTVAQLQKQAVKSAGTAGTRAVIALAILQKTKEIAIESLREQREIFATSRLAMEEADSAILSIHQDLSQALHTEIPQTKEN